MPTSSMALWLLQKTAANASLAFAEKAAGVWARSLVKLCVLLFSSFVPVFQCRLVLTPLPQMLGVVAERATLLFLGQSHLLKEIFSLTICV